MSQTTEETAPARPKGSPGMMILLLVVLVPSLLLGTLAGAGSAAIIGGFVALFALLAAMGGPLRADLRRLALIGPLVAVGAVVPRLVAEVSVPVAFALIVALVFVGGLLPLRGPQYSGVALGLGMGTLFGYAMPLTGVVHAGQLAISGAVGFGVAVLLRVVMGLKDPSGPTRASVASVLDDPGSSFAVAFDTWSSDRPRRWLGTVLMAAGRYRLARRLVSRQVAEGDEEAAALLEREDVRAAAVAEAVRSGSLEEAEPVLDEPARPSAGPAGEALSSALDDAGRAASERDATPVPIPSRFRVRMSLTALRIGVRYGSVQVRHAARTAIAVLLALLVSLLLPPGDPLLPTLLMTTMALVQVSWSGTLSRARDRLLGVVVGGVLVVLVVLLLPPAALLPISLVGLAVGMWFVTARPALGAAGILVMSVGINTELRNLDATHVIVEYVLLTLVALLIGGVLGFVVVPGRRPPKLPVRVEAAVADAVVALTSLGEAEGHRDPERVLRALGEAQAAAQQLTPDRETLTADQERELDRFRGSLQDLLALALFTVTSGDTAPGAPVLARAADLLADEVRPDLALPARPVDGAVLLLAQDVVAGRARLHAVLSRDEPG